jgi:anthraniloyl-CoA monooxygenase
MNWFENAREYVELSPIELAFALMTRSGRVDYEDLKRRDPSFIADYESAVARKQEPENSSTNASSMTNEK